jgi:hypothetical protein
MRNAAISVPHDMNFRVHLQLSSSVNVEILIATWLKAGLISAKHLSYVGLPASTPATCMFISTVSLHFELRFYQLYNPSYNYFRSTSGYAGRYVISAVGRYRR